ncbi:MAG: peptidase T [Succinivibrionaceae bacterium]|nr:peptidase T [Succinivibrionaceae bacterium]
MQGNTVQRGSVEELAAHCAGWPLLALFVKLISYESASDPASQTVPSSAGQLRLGAYLLSLLSKWGIAATQDGNGYVRAELPATPGLEAVPGITLVAHLDTSPEFTGANVRPSLVTDYQGGDIALESGITLNVENTPDLRLCLHHSLVVGNGRTLLGADDKAGVAVLLHLLKELSKEGAPAHGRVAVTFSVDEETGASFTHGGAPCDTPYALTVDGGAIGEINFATFNAQEAVLECHGRAIHPGSGYRRLVNALVVAQDFMALLPAAERPESTQGDEGFYHLTSLSGNSTEARLALIVRDFSEEGMGRRLAYLRQAAALVEARHGAGSCGLTLRRQYGNMEAVIARHGGFMDLCRRAFAQCGVECREVRVRGGTDGSKFADAKVPCPNLFTGGMNFHGPMECLSVEGMVKSYEVARAIVLGLAGEGK